MNKDLILPIIELFKRPSFMAFILLLVMLLTIIPAGVNAYFGIEQTKAINNMAMRFDDMGRRLDLYIQMAKK